MADHLGASLGATSVKDDGSVTRRNAQDRLRAMLVSREGRVDKEELNGQGKGARSFSD